MSEAAYESMLGKGSTSAARPHSVGCRRYERPWHLVGSLRLGLLTQLLGVGVIAA